MKLFKHKTLSVAILTVLSSSAFANSVDAEKVTQLETIEITAEQGVKNEFNVVTTEIKNEKTDTDLRGLLKDEPAIEFGGGNGTSQFISIRGMGQNSIDVKVDNAYNDSQILYHQGRFMLDPALVKIVAVQKGAGAASAGIGATNGAIVAKTVDAQDLLKNSDKNYGAKVNAGYSSNEGHSYGVAAFAANDKFDILVAANRVNEKDYKPGDGFNINNKDTIPYSGLDKISYLVKGGAKIGNHRIGLSHMEETQKGDRLVREEFLTAESSTIAGGRLSLQRQAPAYRETTINNTNLEYSAENLGVVKAATANAYIMQNERYSADDKGNGYAGNVEGPTTTKIITKGANLNLDWDAFGKATVKTGANFRRQEIKPHTFFLDNLNNPEKTDVGVYTEVIGDIGDVTLTAGVRYDHFKVKAMDGKTVSDGAVSPSVAVSWQPIAGLSLSANHNYATRSPRLYDALLTHGKRGITSIAEGTTAETAKNTEVGFNYSRNLTDNSAINVKGSYFWQKIEDALANPQDRHGATGVKEAVNAGFIRNQGYEVDVAYKLGGLTAKAGVAQSKPRIYDTHPANLLSDNPEFAVQVGRTWTAGLSYRFAQPNLEIGARHRSVEAVSNAVLVRNANLANRASYDVTDIFANWKPLGTDQLNVNFAVNNVADKLYYPHSQRAAITTLPAVGRDVRVGFNYTF